MVMNISCKLEKASYNIFFVRAVTVKSLYTLRWRRGRRRNKVKSTVSTGCYPVDTIRKHSIRDANGLQDNLDYFVCIQTRFFLHPESDPDTKSKFNGI